MRKVYFSIVSEHLKMMDKVFKRLAIFIAFADIV